MCTSVFFLCIKMSVLAIAPVGHDPASTVLSFPAISHPSSEHNEKLVYSYFGSCTPKLALPQSVLIQIQYGLISSHTRGNGPQLFLLYCSLLGGLLIYPDDQRNGVKNPRYLGMVDRGWGGMAKGLA